jgi:hypothetical protein
VQLSWQSPCSGVVGLFQNHFPAHIAVFEFGKKDACSHQKHRVLFAGAKVLSMLNLLGVVEAKSDLLVNLNRIGVESQIVLATPFNFGDESFQCVWIVGSPYLNPK